DVCSSDLWTPRPGEQTRQEQVGRAGAASRFPPERGVREHELQSVCRRHNRRAAAATVVGWVSGHRPMDGAIAAGRMGLVTATVMDGKATLQELLGELAARVEKLKANGVTPGLGTLLVGDDPGSHSYVRAKHRDCAKVGITSIQRELPADATQADVERAVDELNADPACTAFIVQLPLPKGLDAGAALGRIDPMKDADGLAPVSLGRLVL